MKCIGLIFYGRLLVVLKELNKSVQYNHFSIWAGVT